MDSFSKGFFAGMGVVLVLAIALGMFQFVFGTGVFAALDKCAKTHNVYQCEMVAVPKTGEK